MKKIKKVFKRFLAYLLPLKIKLKTLPISLWVEIKTFRKKLVKNLSSLIQKIFIKNPLNFHLHQTE